MSTKFFSIVAVLCLISSAQAGVVVDFDAATGPSAVVGDITVILDIATDGSATLNSITGTDAQPAAVVSGSVSVAPASAYQVTLFIETYGGRQTGIGLVGVGNNHIDSGETMNFSLDVDAAPVGTAYKVLGIALDPSTADGNGSITGATSGTLAVTFSGDGREDFNTSALGTIVTQGSGLSATVDLNGGTEVVGIEERFQLCAIELDVVPEPATMLLLGLGGLLLRKRR